MMKNIIVVTGASSGIGREFVEQISKKEKFDEIWAIARNQEMLNKLKEDMNGVNIKVLTLDLTKQEDLDKYKEELNNEKPNIKILVNNAGFGKFEHDENIPTDVKLNMIDLNIKAVVTMTDYSLPYMSESSKIMNVASAAAFQPVPYINVYAATKAFVLSYSRALNVELKYRKIHVLTLCPFWTKTKFFERAQDTSSNKEVIIKYIAMYNAKDVVEKAIKDLYNDKKVTSSYGFLNKAQRFAAKIFSSKFVMKVWMHQQKFNGKKDIR